MFPFSAGNNEACTNEGEDVPVDNIKDTGCFKCKCIVRHSRLINNFFISILCQILIQVWGVGWYHTDLLPIIWSSFKKIEIKFMHKYKLHDL